MDAPTLFDSPPKVPPFQSGSDTSKDAAIALEKSGVAGWQEHMVETALLAAGDYGLTRREIHQQTGFLMSSVCGRIATLIEKGSAFQRAARRDGGHVLVHRQFWNQSNEVAA